MCILMADIREMTPQPEHTVKGFLIIESSVLVYLFGVNYLRRLCLSSNE